MFVLSFGIFSTTASAEEYTDFKVSSRVTWNQYNDNMQNISSWTMQVDHPVNDFTDTDNFTMQDIQTFNDKSYYLDQVIILKNDGSLIGKEGQEITVDVTGIYRMFSIQNISGWYYWKAMDSVVLIGYDSSGKATYYYDLAKFIYDSSQLTGGYTAKLTLKADTKKLIFQSIYTPTVRYGITYADKLVTTYLEKQGSPSAVKVRVQSEEAGLLSGLINWVKEIFEKVKTMAADIASGFANVVKGITELPAKLWTLIEDGLKNLFVPDEQFMSDYSTQWDTVLADRFGAIYESASIIREFWSDLGEADETQSISMPAVSLNSVGIPFSFGGYTVKVVPYGFDFLATACKVITSILCTFLFINGMRKRYDEVMGVEQ